MDILALNNREIYKLYYRNKELKIWKEIIKMTKNIENVAEVIVEEVPEVVGKSFKEGLVKGGLYGWGIAAAVVTYEKGVKPVVKKISKPVVDKFKARKAEKNGQEVNDHEDVNVEEN